MSGTSERHLTVLQLGFIGKQCFFLLPMLHASPPYPWVTNTILRAPRSSSQLASWIYKNDPGALELVKLISKVQIVLWRSPPTPRLTFLGCLSARKRSLTWKTVSGGCISKCPNNEPILTRFNSVPFSILHHCLCCSSALPVSLAVSKNHTLHRARGVWLARLNAWAADLYEHTDCPRICP